VVEVNGVRDYGLWKTGLGPSPWTNLAGSRILPRREIMSEGKRVVRQYPMEFKVDAVKLLDEVALKLNQRPRKTLDFLTPADVLYDTVALTH